MIKSMTGYGKGEATGAGKVITAEVKSVNHRFLEVVVRMPRQYSILEERVRKVIKERVTRGRLDVFLSMEDVGEKTGQVKVDKDLAIAYHSSLKELAQILGISEEFGVFQIAQLPEVIGSLEKQEDIDAVASVLEQAVALAAEQLHKMREEEGANLQVDLQERRQRLYQLAQDIEGRTSVVADEYRDKLAQRIQQILGEVELDPQRLAQEVVFYTDRSDISEELVRLTSHLQQMEEIMRSPEPVGRKLDFLVQEMLREVNTIGSKANDLAIIQKVVDAKSEIEKIREQVQNIE
ncbi:MAG: YicC/YloC family endoribonuclease [Bacillota bacterium]